MLLPGLNQPGQQNGLHSCQEHCEALPCLAFLSGHILTFWLGKQKPHPGCSRARDHKGASLQGQPTINPIHIYRKPNGHSPLPPFFSISPSPSAGDWRRWEQSSGTDGAKTGRLPAYSHSVHAVCTPAGRVPANGILSSRKPYRYTSGCHCTTAAMLSCPGAGGVGGEGAGGQRLGEIGAVHLACLGHAFTPLLSLACACRRYIPLMCSCASTQS